MAPYPNAGVPPPHQQAYYGAPPPSPYPPVPAAPQQHHPPPEPVMPEVYPEFQRHDKEPARRKFKEATTVCSTDGSTVADTNYFSLNKNTGRDVSDSLPAKNGEVVNECKESRENNNPVRTFKESPTVSVRRFEEGPSPLSASRRVNGEAGKTAEAESAKWKSLSISTISIRKEEPESGVGAKDEAKLGGKDESMKEVEATKDKQDSEERDVFARPTFRPSELAPRRMPPAGMLGKDLLHQRSKTSVASKQAPLMRVTSKPPHSKVEATQNIAEPSLSRPSLESETVVPNKLGGEKHLSLVSYSSEDSDSDADP